MTETMSRPSGRDQVAVLRVNGEYALVARHPIPRDTLMFRLEGEVTPAPTRHSVQVGTGVHLDLPDDCGAEEVTNRFYWRFMNHSCSPSATMRGRDVFSLRLIAPREEITFNYNTTEFELAEPFACRCGSDHCAKWIGGFHHLAPAEKERLRPCLADHLLPLVDSTCR
ncbi:SET domain-containing protein-lysine N-methyltransferase [Amycolatopsis taiwanensis]|uniref:SET domain-containing protein-lysine N-methyltransferase n=1 Tax=Amycolatopsis taiwanensis TaxID=342230 RepID=UPI000482DBE0|nr:SET domain-containing protein-lysine N-methyltransferase [Amycolatopsis taiwanensis]